jgi:hypothetical protein
MSRCGVKRSGGVADSERAAGPRPQRRRLGRAGAVDPPAVILLVTADRHPPPGPPSPCCSPTHAPVAARPCRLADSLVEEWPLCLAGFRALFSVSSRNLSRRLAAQLPADRCPLHSPARRCRCRGAVFCCIMPGADCVLITLSGCMLLCAADRFSSHPTRKGSPVPVPAAFARCHCVSVRVATPLHRECWKATSGQRHATRLPIRSATRRRSR